MASSSSSSAAAGAGAGTAAAASPRAEEEGLILRLPPSVIDRIAAGDYEGMRNTAGRSMPSIFREYADGVITGIADYFRSRRPMLA